jgi:YbbR domain-containing protein
VRRALALLVRNWPLKVAALVLAILLYGVVVVGQNARVFPGSIPIVARNEPSGAIVLSNLPNVTEVRYLANKDPNLRVDTSSFQAYADLSGVNPNAGIVSVPVKVEAPDSRVQVLSWSPDRVQIQVDQVITAQVPVRVNEVSVPPQFDVRPPVMSQDTVTVRGAASTVRQVDHVEARVQIDPAGFDFDRDVELVPVDAFGEAVPQPISVDPATVRVQIAVFKDRETRTLPVAPDVTGTPAPGFEIVSVKVAPLVVNVEGDSDQLATLVLADTAPISVDGATADVTTTVDLALPTGVLQIGPARYDVTITIRAIAGSRSFNAGIALAGARADRTYRLSTDQVVVTIGGPLAQLDALQGQTLQVTANVAGLGPGSHEVKLAASLPAGLTALTISPAKVTIAVGVPSPSPPAAAGASASPSQAP